MPDKRVTELDAIASVVGTDLVLVVDDPAGTPVSKKATVNQVLVDVARTNVSNTFTGDQTVDGDLFVTGEINPVFLRAQLPKIYALEGRSAETPGDPAGSRTVMSQSLVSGLSVRHEEDLSLGRITVGNYDTQIYEPLLIQAESFQVHTGVSPGVRAERLRVHPTGGVTVGADHAVDPGGGGIRAGSLDLTEGVPPNPSLDTARLYALDVNGYTQVEMRDGNAKVVRFASDNVLIAKVSGVAVTRGQCLYLAGATGANPLVGLARADALATMPGVGLALDAGAVNDFIRVLLLGTMQLIDTSAFAEGARLYVSPTTAGSLTTTVPVAPAFAQRVGVVTRSHATDGEVLVQPTSVDGPPRLHRATHEPGGSDALTALDAAILTTGVLPDARLSANVLKYAGGYPGGTVTYLRADGTFAAPPVGTGDVVGPASATNTALALFSGTTGKLLSAGADGTISGSLAIGTTPSTIGALRLANTRTIHFRNAANTADVQGMVVGADNRVAIGLKTNPAETSIAGKGLQFEVDNPNSLNYTFDGVMKMTINSSGIFPQASLMQLGSNAVRWFDICSDLVSLGSTPATSGGIRLPNATGIFARNQANTANVELLKLDNVNVVYVGGVAVPNIALKNAANTFTQPQTFSSDITATGGLGTTPLNATYLTTGTVADARLTANVLKFTGGYPGGTADFLRADGTFTAPPAGSLPSNVALTDAANTFTASQTIAGDLSVRTDYAGNVKLGTGEWVTGLVCIGSSDGFHNGQLFVSGGGNSATGGGLILTGNNYPGEDSGGVIVRCGDVAAPGGNITFALSNAYRGRMHRAGGFSWGDMTDPGVGVITATGGLGTTPLNATYLTTGTVADARLTANVALKNAENTFTECQTINNTYGFLQFVHPTAPANERNWQLVGAGSTFHLWAVSDAGDLLSEAVYFDRFGRAYFGNKISERSRIQAMGDWISYTPTLKNASDTALSYTALSFKYALVGTTCFFSFFASAIVVTGATTAHFRISVPVAPSASAPMHTCIGHVFVGNGASFTFGRTQIDSAGYLRVYAGASNGAWPIGNHELFGFDGFYEI